MLHRRRGPLPSLRQLNPLRNFVEPLVAGLAVALLGFALAWWPAAVAGGLLLIVLSGRVAYDHRGAGRYSLPIRAPAWRTIAAAPTWWRRQLTGALLFYVAVWLIVGSLRHIAV